MATPGRMLDHLRNSMSVHLDELAVLILDEADRLLQIGFATEIQELVSFLFHCILTLMFFASFEHVMLNSSEFILSLLVSSPQK